jgi:hypothetical protein
MNPGPAQILTCPHCGAKKEVLSLLSGNTFGQQVWSDNKSIAPMLPKVSFVQKCPSCNGYYLMSRQKPKTGSNYSFEQGELSYFELKEAWRSLQESVSLTDDEKLSILIMQVWAFNDEYSRTEVKPIPPEEQSYIISIIDTLLAQNEMDDLIKAELLRESGRFEESVALLNNYITDDEFLKKIIGKLREEIFALSTRPFLISNL